MAWRNLHVCWQHKFELMNFLNTLSSGKKKWLTVTRWLLFLGCWVLIAVLVGKARDWKVKQDYLQLGPESIVGEHSVIYQEAPDYLYTNPVAMICHNMRCLGVQAGIVLLFAVLATASLGAWKTLSQRKVWLRLIPILFCVAMSLSFLFLAVVCVWEWGVAWLALLGCAKFLPQWSVKSRFTVMALIVAMVFLGLRRMDFKAVSRQYDAFWNSAEKCATIEQFTENFGKPVILIRNATEEHQEWFENLAQIDQSLWLPGNTLAGFISPKMPDILLLPWFDDDGKRVALAWCDLTPERRTFITEKSPKTE